jgi:hypothetical protein
MSDRTKRFTTLITIVLILGISVTAESLPKAIPEKVGLSSKRLERVSELFQDLVDQQQLAGVVALVARQVQAPGLPVAHRMKGFHTVSIGSFFE